MKTREAWTQAVGRLTRPQKPRSKYGAKKTVIDNIAFDSKREALRYHELKLMQQAGQITSLRIQPVFELEVNSIHVGKYTADFRYEQDGETVVEDVKSPASKTEAYQLRKRVCEACYGIQIRET